MLTYLQAIVLGALQGISELFPVSSLGHSVILPQLLGWQVNEQAPFFLMFLVATHFATAVVLALFYWRDWVRIIGGFFRSFKSFSSSSSSAKQISPDPYARLAWLIIIGTVPAGILGLIFKNSIQSHLLSAKSAAIFLILNGFLLYGAEILRKKRAMKETTAGGTMAGEVSNYSQTSDARIAHLSWPRGFWIGIVQSLALIPGFSRTGATFGGGLTAGLSHEDALRFSFLLSTPVIGAAALLELPKLLLAGLNDHSLIGIAFVGAVASALFAYLAVRFLTRYFSLENSSRKKADGTTAKKHSLTPFAIYCVAAGIISLLILFV